jgi:hypothetical protein
MARNRTQPPATKSGLFPHALLRAVLVWSWFGDYTQVCTVGCPWKQTRLAEQSHFIGCSEFSLSQQSEAYNFWKELKPNTLTRMSTSKFFRRLRASATRFCVPALCLMTKLNCCKYAAQDACRDEILSLLPMCLRASWLTRPKDWCLLPSAGVSK